MDSGELICAVPHPGWTPVRIMVMSETFNIQHLTCLTQIKVITSAVFT